MKANWRSVLSRRFERDTRILRARRRALDLTRVGPRDAGVRKGDILLAATLRNEAVRMPYFLDYYRRLGVDRFLIVDNGSDDGTFEMLSAQKDVALWRTEKSYKRAAYGMHWLNHLLNRHGVGHWAVVVDADEFLVFPHMDTRGLRALTRQMDQREQISLGALLIDLYPKGPVADARLASGQDPLEVAPWFDPGGYVIERHARYRNLWIRGGPRLRAFFLERPAAAPALNKIPLVKWRRGAVFVSSTHALLPRAYNVVYDQTGGEKLCGALLHAKFVSTLTEKAKEEAERNQHFSGGREYAAYREALTSGLALWDPQSERYSGWRRLVELELMSDGGWL